MARGALRVAATVTACAGFLIGLLVCLGGLGVEPPLPVSFATALDRLVRGATWLCFGSGTIAAIAGALLAFLSLQVLVAVTWWSAPRHRLFQVALTDRGFVVVDEESIETLAAQAARTARGVADVRIRVRGPEAGPLGIRAKVGLTPGAPVAQIGPEVQQRVLEAVERLAGIPVSSVSVQTHVLRTGELTRLLS